MAQEEEGVEEDTYQEDEEVSWVVGMGGIETSEILGMSPLQGEVAVKTGVREIDLIKDLPLQAGTGQGLQYHGT